MTAKDILNTVRINTRAQRDREAQALKVFLTVSIPCSIVFHLVILSTFNLNNFWNNSPVKEELIEVVAVNPSESQIEEKSEEKVAEAKEENLALPQQLEDIAAIPPTDPPTAIATPNAQLANSAPAPSAKSDNPAQPLPDSAPPRVLTGTAASSLTAPNAKFGGNGNTPNSNAISKIRGLLRGSGTAPNGRGTSPTGTGTSPTATGNAPSNSGNTSTTNPSRNGSGKISCQNCAKPDYPLAARERNLEGQAKVSVDVDANGNVTNVRIVNSSGHQELDQAAIEAARKWKFTPSDAGKTDIPAKINFQLENSEYARQQEEQRRQRELEQQSVPQALPNTDTAKTDLTAPTLPSNTTTTKPESVSTPSSTITPKPQQSTEPIAQPEIPKPTPSATTTTPNPDTSAASSKTEPVNTPSVNTPAEAIAPHSSEPAAPPSTTTPSSSAPASSPLPSVK